MSDLYESLIEYSTKDVYPLHMPGHKRNTGGYSSTMDPLTEILPLDITEIDGFDNLHDASGLIKEAEHRIAKIYNSGISHIMVNGSTGGILSAISAVANRGDSLLMARNCHKSVYHAAFLNRLNCVYLWPKVDDSYDINGPITPAQVRNQIEEAVGNGDKIAAVIITSPTYDGVVSDINNIAKVAHEYDIPLIVDEAHGAHFGLEEHFPESSVRYADIVIHSVHKTLPAPTQTAIIHINSSLIDQKEVERYLGIYQTSSPSYVLMAGIDRAMDIVEAEGRVRLNKLYELRCELDNRLKDMQHIRICPYTEPGKLVISLKGSDKTGLWLSEKLRTDYNIETEMSCSSYALGILTMMDTKEGIDRIADALIKIDGSIGNNEASISKSMPQLMTQMSLFEAWNKSGRWTYLKESANKVASNFLIIYPPGIPLAVPGEVISEELIEIIQNYEGEGFNIQGMDNEKIKVL